MSGPGRTGPPRWILAFLRLTLPNEPASASFIGDLIEEFGERERIDGPHRARRWLTRQTLAVGAYAIRDRIMEAPVRWSDRGRQNRGDGMMRLLLADLRLAARSLRRAPGFSIIATIMLAIGIGANTAIFSAVNGVLLQPLDFPDSEQLVSVGHTVPGFDFDEIPLSPDTYVLIKNENRVFTDIAAVRPGATVNLTGDHDPRVLEATHVSWELPSVLGLTFALGRGFTEEEDRPEGSEVAVISHGLWQETYGSDPSILGRTIELDGTPVEVVGVLPREVDLPNLGVDLWLPIRIDLDAPEVGSFGTNAIARLQPGRTAEVAEQNLAPITDLLLEQYPDAQNYRAFITNGRFGTLVDPLREQVVGDLQRPLWILLGTVAFVLLIACANVANLVLVRVESRQKEIAVRAALGARRRDIMRYMVTEGAVLAIAGGLLGVLLAFLGLPAILSLTPESLPRADGVQISAPVLGFTALLVALSVLLFGVAPAARAFTPRMFGTLKHSRGSTDGRERHRVRNALVAGQTALALMLLIGSGLMLRSFGELRDVHPGFEAEGLLTFSLTLPAATYESPRAVADFHQQILQRLQVLPGVVSAGAAGFLPLSGGGSGTAHRAEDVPVDPGELPPVMFFKTVAPGYFETMRTRLVAGRTLTRSDHEQGLPNIVINTAVADRMWPGQDPLNRRLGATSADSIPTWYTVVGVVEPVRDVSLTDDPREQIYYPMVAPDGSSFANARTMTYVVRTEADPSSLVGTVRRAVWEFDSNLPVADIREMQAIVSESTARMSFTMIALGVAALVALLLGAVGLYGVLSYIVAQRTREIGVRIALGAQSTAVRTMVVRQGLLVAGAGLAVGLIGALALTRVLESLLFGTSPRDPVTYVTTALLLLLVGVLASYIPARRASAIDPMKALRAE